MALHSYLVTRVLHQMGLDNIATHLAMNQVILRDFYIDFLTA